MIPERICKKCGQLKPIPSFRAEEGLCFQCWKVARPTPPDKRLMYWRIQNILRAEDELPPFPLPDDLVGIAAKEGISA